MPDVRNTGTLASGRGPRGVGGGGGLPGRGGGRGSPPPAPAPLVSANTSTVVAATDAETDLTVSADDGPPGIAGVEDRSHVWYPAAELLSAVADPIRLAVLDRLTGGTVHVAQLLDEIPVAPNLLSYHLKVLRDAGLIAGSRRGRCIDYQLTPDALQRLHAALPQPPPDADTPG